VKAFEAVLALNPDSVDALRALAALSVERNDFEQALRYQGRLIDKGERSPELFYNTGLLLHQSGQLDDAERLYREALSERSEFPEALLNLGHVLKSQGKQDEARNCWRQAVEQKPDFAQNYFASN
jgi:tetratricopeptide (TPR) repeat protein